MINIFEKVFIFFLINESKIYIAMNTRLMYKKKNWV